jgi:hypothetical protein
MSVFHFMRIPAEAKTATRNTVNLSSISRVINVKGTLPELGRSDIRKGRDDDIDTRVHSYSIVPAAAARAGDADASDGVD